MKVDCQYKSLDSSTALTEYTQQRFLKLSHLELKPTSVQVTFSRDRRHEHIVEARLIGVDIIFKATASAESFKDAIESCILKLEKQMYKKKSRLQNHKNYKKSARGRLENINEYLEDTAVNQDWLKAS